MKTKRRTRFYKFFMCPCSPDVGDCPKCSKHRPKRLKTLKHNK